jgi:hypothetical protein
MPTEAYAGCHVRAGAGADPLEQPMSADSARAAGIAPFG